MAHVPVPKTERLKVPGYTRARRPDPEERVEVSVYVRRDPKAAALPAIERLGAELPRDRTHLGRAEADAIFGASRADLEEVEAFARAHRLHVVDASPRTRRVLLSGRVADLEAAFGVALHRYEKGSQSYRGREGAVHVPAELAGVVEGVFGLDDRPIGRSRARRPSKAKITTFPALDAMPADIYYPPQVARLYDYPEADGAGQTIAILAFNGTRHGGGYSVPALRHYFTRILGQGMPHIAEVVVRGPGNGPGRDDKDAPPDDNTGEIMLDIQVAGAVAPGAKIAVYFTELTEQGWVDGISAVVADETHDPDILSCSFGNAESGAGSMFTPAALERIDEAFQMAAARGVVVCAASGDDGSEDDIDDGGAHADFPASSPYVLGCGGTRLLSSGGVIQREVAWHDSHGSTGGGVSAFFPLPRWQAKAGVPRSANAPHTPGRGVPDVAGLADPETGVIVISVDGKTPIKMGGTSITAPLWAGLLARINQGLGRRVGYLNPLLYTGLPRGVFRDIVTGENGAYRAKAGWDALTGLGSPHGGRLLAALRGERVTASG